MGRLRPHGTAQYLLEDIINSYSCSTGHLIICLLYRILLDLSDIF